MFQPRLIQTSAEPSRPLTSQWILSHIWLALATTPAFAICHDGAGMQYLVLCYWGNDNELFTRVSVNLGGAWVEDPATYAFCLWDMEVMWAERAIFIDTLYSGNPDLAAYRARRPEAWLVGAA